MSLLSFSHSRSDDPRSAEAALQALLVRMKRRLYPETLPVLASCWLKTLCSSGHNRAWWVQLRDRMDRALLDHSLDESSRAVLLSARNWTEATVLAGGELPAARHYGEPPFRSLSRERLVPYIGRLLNEWLPAEVAYLLTQEEDYAHFIGDGIPVLARAKALDRLLIREHLSPETLEMLLTDEMLSPRLIDPSDLEIVRDVVLALLGRIVAPDVPVLPAELLGVTAGSALPSGYAERVKDAFLVRTEDGREELHVPISDGEAMAILQHDPVRIGSVVVTMDGRAWQSCMLDRSDGDRIVYRPGERLRIDVTADHAKLAVPWQDMPSSWSGGLPSFAPFQLFGREWRAVSLEMNGSATLLHLTFTRVLPVDEPAPESAERAHLHQAHVDMAWSELERALGEAVARKSGDPIEQMHRDELIPLGRALYALIEPQQIETHLRAARYHHASVESVYGRAPWRVLPASLQAGLAKQALRAETFGLLSEVFTDVPLVARRGPGSHSTSPSQAA